MQKLKLKFVYQNLTIDEKQNVINLWVNSGVLNTEQAKQRVDQVSVLILNDLNEVVGVSTVYQDDFILNDHKYFYLRMFISQPYRGNNALLPRIMQLTFQELKKRFSSNVYGLVIVLENQHFIKLSDETEYFPKKGFSYFGKKEKTNFPIWYVRFDEPRGIFV